MNAKLSRFYLLPKICKKEQSQMTTNFFTTIYADYLIQQLTKETLPLYVIR